MEIEERIFTADEDQRTVFNIPAENMEKFEAQIAKLSRRSEKLIGRPIKPLVFAWENVEMADGQKHRVYEVMLTAEVPKIEGWTFMARLDHSNETGTIIRMVPNVGEVPAEFRNASHTRCDHCNINRYRRDTFVVRNDETGEFKQVGSSCLKDFFGHDPYKIAKMAELLGYAYECARGGEQYVGGDLRWIDLETFLGYSAMACRLDGWVSGKAAWEDNRLTSTREMATTLMHMRDKLEGADIALAEEALAWARTFADKPEMTDYEHNISVIANAEMIEPRSRGLAASIVGVYFNNKRREVVKPTNIGSFEGVVALFAENPKLKNPKLRLALTDGRPLVLKVIPTGKFPGSIGVTDGGGFDNNIWYGRVHKDGRWEPGRAVDPATMTSLTALLSALAVDPAGTAAAYGHMTGNCCFCNTRLKTKESKEVGYGPDCAAKRDLPWGSKRR